MKTDSLFYRLFQALPRLFFDLVGLPTLPAEQYRFQSVELKQTALRLDGLFRPPEDRSDLPLFFIEVQFQPTKDLYPRLFAEIFLYLKQYQPPHPWQAVVIYPSRAVDPGDYPHYATLLHSAQGPPDLLGSVSQVSPNLLPAAYPSVAGRPSTGPGGGARSPATR